MPRLPLFLLSISLLFAFLWGSSGAGFLDAVHSWHRQAAQRHVAGRTADTILLSRSDYERLTAADAGEIEWHGEMYDIVSATPLGGQVRLVGHYDRFDRHLFKMIDRLLGDEPDEGKDAGGVRLFLYTGILPAALLWECKRAPVYAARNDAGAASALFFLPGEVLKAPPKPLAS